MADAQSANIFIGEAVSSGKSGSVPFIDVNGRFAQNNPLFNFDDAITQLRIGPAYAEPLVGGFSVNSNGVGSPNPNINLALAISSPDAPSFNFIRSRGTLSLPLDVLSGDFTSNIESLAYSGGTWFKTGAIRSAVDGTFTSGQRPPSRLEFYTNTASGAQTIQATVRSNGDLVLRGTSPWVDVKAYGAAGDGSTDDTVAVQNAQNSLIVGGDLFFPAGTYIVSGAAGGTALTANNSNVTWRGVYGQSIIKAKAATDFQYVIQATSKTQIKIEDLVIDANGTNRAAALTTATTCIRFTTCTEVYMLGVIAKGALGTLLASGPAVTLGATRAVVSNCIFEGNGTSTKQSDGIYCTGTQIIVSSCVATNCTDTGFVLENCNQSGIVGCTALACGSGAAITNFGGSVVYGNYIDGLTIYDWSATVLGALLIGITGNGNFNLQDTVVSNVVITNVSGTGPALTVQQTGAGTGVVSGLAMSNITINGAGTQGMLISGTNITLNGGSVTSTGTPIQLQGTSSKITIRNMHLFPAGTFGCYMNTGLTNCEVRDCFIVGAGASMSYGIYCAGTSTGLMLPGNTIIGATTSKIGADATTTPVITFETGIGTATSGAVSPHTFDGLFQDGGVNSSTQVNLFTLSPTFNYTGGSKTGFVNALRINPINTSLPTGQNAAISLSAAASVLGGIVLNNQSDEQTNFEALNCKWSSNVALFNTVKGSGGTLRSMSFGPSGVDTIFNISGQVVHQFGTNALPAVTFTGKTNYGLWYDNANSAVSIALAGADSFRLGTNSVLSLINNSALLRLGASADTVAGRNAAGVFNLGNGTNGALVGYDGTNVKIAPSTGQLYFAAAAKGTADTVGYFTIPSSAGAPTGVPASIPTGQIPYQYDGTNDKLYAYRSGWKKAQVNVTGVGIFDVQFV